MGALNHFSIKEHSTFITPSLRPGSTPPSAHVQQGRNRETLHPEQHLSCVGAHKLRAGLIKLAEALGDYIKCSHQLWRRRRGLTRPLTHSGTIVNQSPIDSIDSEDFEVFNFPICLPSLHILRGPPCGFAACSGSVHKRGLAAGRWVFFAMSLRTRPGEPSATVGECVWTGRGWYGDPR